MTLAPALAEGISALGLELPEQAPGALLDYLQLLAKWNRTHNLTAINEPARMVTHHLLDSLAVLPHLGQGTALTCLDVGSGGGLPGIPLAIARPQWRVTLLDSNGKKAIFLRQAALELALANVDVVSQRVEAYEPPRLFEIVISRAFSDLATFARGAFHLLAPGGRLVAMKGVIPHEELPTLPVNVSVTELKELRVPGIDGARHLVIMQASAP